jgi:hypothetical protein
MKQVMTLLVVCAIAGTASAQPAPMTPVWRVDGLDSPESVILAPDGRSLLISNVGGEGDAKDGDGFIARVSLDGRLLQRTWAKGLNGPKGLAIRGCSLFVSDIETLVELDAQTGRRLNDWPIPGARFLNDAAVLSSGAVLVADSGGARIYALDRGKVGVWLAHPDLRSVNGLLPERDRLIVTTMQGLLLAVDYRTKAVTRLATGLGEGDGVAAIGGGRYLVSEWPGRLFEVGSTGHVRVLADSRAEPRYINDFIVVAGLLIAPNWTPGSLSAYRLPH